LGKAEEKLISSILILRVATVTAQNSLQNAPGRRFLQRISSLGENSHNRVRFELSNTKLFQEIDSFMTADASATIGKFRCGADQPLVVIAGPCVIESEKLCLDIAESLVELTKSLAVNVVFKASFDKANRTAASSRRGPGLEDGLKILQTVKDVTGLAVTTDIHLPEQAAAVAEVCDMLQIPAFLCRQTDLLLAAAATGRAVNVKKGQFMAPADMQHVVTKLAAGGCRDTMLCERGTFFGYGRLVNDFTGLSTMRSFGVPVIFDATHSVQRPASHGDSTGGDRTLVEPLARAAAAIGIDGVFFETHPDPDSSPSDGPNMVPLTQFRSVLERVLQIHALRVSMDAEF
jgi:2-dehydro-3-deoxyphosphooctonate aldolase (KDO 8-P synthase)